jgi:predicted HicB family RNase H-like nuclease
VKDKMVRIKPIIHAALFKEAKNRGLTVSEYVERLMTAAWIIDEVERAIAVNSSVSLINVKED